MTKTQSVKYGFVIGFVIIFCIWLGWYTLRFLNIEKAEVRKAAALGLTCAQDQVTVGRGYQFNDGPSEFPVEGCGKSGRVFCDDNGYQYGMIKQYFVVDMTCRFQKQL